MALSFDEEISLASEQERSRWMHRRLLIYCLVSIAAAGVELAVHVIALALGEGPFLQNLASRSGYDLLPGMVAIAVFAAGYARARNRQLDRLAVIRYSFLMIFAVGVMAFLIRPIFASFPLRTLVSGTAAAHMPGRPSIFGRVLMIHLTGALFMPWTVREAFRILLALCGLGVLSNVLFADGSIGHRVFAVMTMPVAGVPGIAFCWFRYSRFRNKFKIKHLLGRYGQLQQELEQARRIHELLFPNEITEGPFQLRYRYEPMQQIGGDYVYVHRDKAERLSIVVLDVTGHGITAALTVNRIHGELDRLFGEDDDRQPGNVLKAVNRYFCVSLARHGIFATAVAVRIDQQEDRLEWANAGHPPPFVLDTQGRCVPLDSNAVMLGVLDDPAYECSTQTRQFSDEDRLVLYTDGVIEAHDERYEMLDLEGLQQVLRDKTLRPAREPLSEELLREVQRFRKGPAEDDVLIVELSRTSTPVVSQPSG